MARLSKGIAIAALTVPLMGGAAVITANPAEASVKCGDNITSYFGPRYMIMQRLTYINCTGRTRHRRANIAGAKDPGCTRIGPWRTVSLIRDVHKTFWVHIRGSKAC